ncbi:MAG: UDP-N-acetylmuramyl-tripeptide synthetase [Candidatus Uhrbacteria bacterium GW2011_GWA2_53_10]|uniref:UDP-N-acetylmuramyl-tripeptide synthetase n=1 Tax=Candidatus Uhrbacteria bacterium GW2011_GWA2_53_10 TaxID=1618980 RepID=A0A0G1ZXQ0_9BACT|nr:MAG: UDP-N-acetylmuramyl-tripeptide synthetase [Candidatus Uhrbacteria bacterium GW2011_GWA2_53_10]
MLKTLLRRCVPEPFITAYHFILAKIAAQVYGHPSEKMVVIGVTGTNGKSSTVQFIGRMLEHAGFRVGWTSTAGFNVAGKEWVNDKKMTMLGRFQTQRLLRDMVRAGCTHVIIETSSQGVIQHRHVGINYDMAVFTNLTPEHIEAHGGFENYKKAKGKFFAHVAKGHRKTIVDQTIEKTCIVNVDDEHAEYFLSFPFDRRYGYGRKGQPLMASYTPVIAEDVMLAADGSRFRVSERDFVLKPLGLFYIYNALAAITTLHAMRIDWQTLRDATARLTPVAGRLEAVSEGQPFSVIVDYAYEPAAMRACYDAVRLFKYKRLIHVLGSAGGGRDRARRAVLGAMAGREADIVIVTNEDPYDEEPMDIIHQVADGALQAGKQDGRDLFRVLDRAEAIRLAVSVAEPNDLVLLTGKGSEPVIAGPHGKKIPWDDRSAARAALHHLQ